MSDELEPILPGEPHLTDEQKKEILRMFNNPSETPYLKDIIQALFGKDVDGRSDEGRLVKEYLATLQLKPKTSKDYAPKEATVLSEDQKLFVANNAKNMNALEITRVLFKDNTLTNLNKETRAVNDYLKTLDPKVLYGDTSDIPEGKYEPPKTLDKVLRKVNEYVHEGIKKEEMTTRQKKELESLIGYMHVYRFNHQINTYQKATDRKLFEDSFIRFTYNKADLTQEETNQYITLCSDVVTGANIQRRVEQLQAMLEQIAQTADPEQVKISMSLVEAINAANTELNQCASRQKQLYAALTQTRSTKLKEQIQENASILNLVTLWKEEESRNRLIRLAQLQKESIKNEVEHLSSMEEIKARILGLSKAEAING